MPVPRFDDKHLEESLTRPEEAAEYAKSRGSYPDAEPPSGVVLCYNPVAYEHLIETYADAEIGGMPPLSRGACHTVRGTSGRIAVVGDFGIGSPTAAMVVEALVEYGVETFLSIGYVGCLQPDVGMDEFVVCEEAIRDEGTSYHYLPDSRTVSASPELVSHVEGVLEASDDGYVTGTSWTTDAPGRETRAEIEHYREEGVLSVDMEAAAVFAVAEYWDVEAASLFTVSDYLSPDGWERRFHETSDNLRHLSDVAVEALSSYAA